MSLSFRARSWYRRLRKRIWARNKDSATPIHKLAASSLTDVASTQKKEARATRNAVERSGESNGDLAAASIVDQSLWDRAYKLLGQENEELVKKYEEVLVEEAQKSGTI
jgi:hypothetical protein